MLPDKILTNVKDATHPVTLLLRCQYLYFCTINLVDYWL
jgi:hypothetical protein